MQAVREPTTEHRVVLRGLNRDNGGAVVEVFLQASFAALAASIAR